MTRNRLFLVAGGLAIPANVMLIFGIKLLHKNIASYIASNYRQYSRDVRRKALRLHADRPNRLPTRWPSITTRRRAPPTAPANTCATATTS